MCLSSLIEDQGPVRQCNHCLYSSKKLRASFRHRKEKLFLGHAVPKVQDLFANTIIVCMVPRNFVPQFDTGKESFFGSCFTEGKGPVR